MKKTTKILWLSRHCMTTEQLCDLLRIYGKIEIIRYDKTVASWQEVVEAGKDCDILAVVLPPTILADLTNPQNNTKPVIRAKSNRVETGKSTLNPATGKHEKEYKFEHAGWERVVKIEIVVEEL